MADKDWYIGPPPRQAQPGEKLFEFLPAMIAFFVS
jgi:hypothetical protein